ncbi:DUF2169 domain-containing protein [Sorangium sp. So ce448]|uniref:DUF2169 family type VI secretion system accessory protein n=1 Tax=Sorangium sp. So ce448 TaxID=3133314 RepID=UPI003F5D929C
MDVVSLCRLRVSSLPWQPRPGVHAFTAVCKATYDLQPGTSPLSVEQEPPWENDVYSEDDPSWMRAASDLAPFKRRADVLVVGRAHAPRGPSSRARIARISVGQCEKAVQVPAGGARTDVLGLGPIAPTCSARTAMLGRHAAHWVHRAWNTRPLPEDVDGAFFNVASTDQQLPHLAGDERILLELLHPRHERLETRLLRVAPRALVHRRHAAPQELRLRCDTLTIDAHRGLATLVWRGVVVLSDPADDGRVTVTAQIGEESTHSAQPLVAPAPRSIIEAPGVKSREAAVVSGALIERSIEEDDASTSTIALHGQIEAHSALPFAPGSTEYAFVSSKLGERAAVPSPTDSEEGEGTGTALLQPAATLTTLQAAMPFRQDHPRAAENDERSATGFMAFAHLDVHQPAMVQPVAEETNAIVERPPMLGHRAAPERVVVSSEPCVSDTDSPLSEASLTEPDPASVEISIEQCATIAAEIAEKRVERGKVLESHRVDERTWRESERRWHTALKEEAGTGQHSLRKAYDKTYVARVEEFRGPITLEEYMRIAVGLERGNADVVLSTLQIQRPALMPIVRWWTKRVAEDMRLAEKASRALREARMA